MRVRNYYCGLFIIGLIALCDSVFAQCGGILEPGFKFLTSSRGCAPYTVNLQTLYLSSVPGTKYFIDWGDGTAEESFTQVNASGVTIAHTYPNASVNCGYDVVIDASNACNARGSVVEINTQVIVWTNDIVSINPAVFRVCQGFAADLSFTDNSQWNCFPRATRENNEPRWIQWVYGTGPLANQIPNVQVNTILPGLFPYLDPGAVKNPMYPVVSPGQISLPIQIPITTLAQVGKEFLVTLKNWNQCNAYDNNLADGSLNPVNGDLINGDNLPKVITGRIVIVASPQPAFVTRLQNSSGAIQSVFCIGDNIFFDEQTLAIGGASFGFSWQFFDNPLGAGTPISTATSANPKYAYTSGGQKLIRLMVKDNNAVGGCINSVDRMITISPSLIAKINVTDLFNNSIIPSFCQQTAAPFASFSVRVIDTSVGGILPTTQWRWEFYDEKNNLIRQEPASGFSSSPLGPFDQAYMNNGIYRIRLRIRDSATSCESEDEIQIKIYEKPIPFFTASRVCEGSLTLFEENSTLISLQGEKILTKEWDFNYDGLVFNKDPAFDNQVSFTRSLGNAGIHSVALQVTTDVNSCSNFILIPVVVDPTPLASFSSNVTSGCAPLKVIFTNTSVIGQPDTIDRLNWEVDEGDGLGFKVVSTQRPNDLTYSQFTNQFNNTSISNKVFNVRLRVITIHNCEKISSTQAITVFPGTISGFSELNYSPFNSNCSPLSVNFKVDSQTQSLSPADYLWKVIDGGGVIQESSTGTNPNFNFKFSNFTNSFKDYKVTLTSTLSSGCKGDSTRTIRISPVPTSLLIIDTLKANCDTVRLRATAAQKGLSVYHWVITENGLPIVNTSSGSDQIERDFTRPKSTGLLIQFSLDAKNFANCVSAITSASIAIPTQDNLDASFSVTPLSQTLPNATISISKPVSTASWNYLWDFGDGSTSSNLDIKNHTYGTYGSFIISLTASNRYCAAKTSQTITVLPSPPIIDFSIGPPSGCMPWRVVFKNLSQYADIKTYQWEFGDGDQSTEVNPTHVYQKPGTYSVSLAASNVTGKVVRLIKTNVIEVYPKPVASFDVKPKLIYLPGGVLYTSNLSFEATTFFWDFGDGITSTEFKPEHIYREEGTYTIQLEASNQYGCTDKSILANEVRVQRGGQILLPNAFSPSSSGISGGTPGDGKNDTFLPVMRGVVDFEMLVFNRWGELLFETKDASRGWDGTFNGRVCQQDVYMYKLSARFENGELIVRVGDINLIR